MLLVEAIAKLHELAEESAICARKPWSGQSECRVVALEVDTLTVPASVKAAGFEYFLEVHVAKEVLEVFGDRDVELDDRVRLLVHYAEHDAYPEWVYAS